MHLPSQTRKEQLIFFTKQARTTNCIQIEVPVVS